MNGWRINGMLKKEEIWKEEGKMFNEQFSMLKIQLREL